MSGSRQDVQFPTHDGVALHGWLYLPEGVEGPVPAVILTHGFTATKEMGLAAFAEVFAAAGMAALVYDHRCLGASGGEPHFYVDAWVQSRDMLDAIRWLGARAEVDADRIGLWGTSFSGGVALATGALDPAVRAIVGIVPAVGQADTPEVGTAEGFAAFEARIRTATVETQLRDIRRVIPEEGSDDLGMMGAPESITWFSAEAAKTEGRWANRVLLPADPGVMPFNPAVAASHLHGPALFIAATGDRFAPAAAAEAVVALAPEGSRFIAEEGDHFSLYGGDAFERASAAARDFFLHFL